MVLALKTRLAKFARITAKIAVGLMAFALLLVLALFIVNSFDVPLSDEAKALLAPPPNPYPADQNLYLATAGLEGPGDRPIIEMGQERIGAYNQALDPTVANSDAASKLNEKWDAAKIRFSGTLDLGKPLTTSIWTDAKSHGEDIAALLKSNQTLYQRYVSLHRLHGYYETAHPSFLAPVISLPPPLQKLFLANVANRIQIGTSQQQRDALNDLEEDRQMWRTVLKGDGTLIGKMLAAARLHEDLILIGDLVTDSSTELKSLDSALDRALLPFDIKDYRIGNAFAAEFRATATLYKTITFANEYALSPAPPWRQRVWNAFQAHFFKVNDTENRGAQQVSRWVALGNSEPSHFLADRDADRDWFKDNVLHLSPRFVYNPTGKILAALAVSQNDSYFLRVYDVAAYQRLILLVYQIKRQHIAKPDVAAFLKAHPEWSTHPIDGRTFRWNVESGELAVNTLGEHPKEQRFNVALR